MPRVALVGRPNVGKSTLFNRMLGRREAIVEERPGVTRDRKEAEAEWQGRSFVVVDTGGWMPGGSELDAKVSRQAERAVLDADVAVLVVDATVGVTDDDEAVARWLRRRARAVLVAVNKADADRRDLDAWVFARLGVGDPFPISALHGRGTGDLLDALVERFPAPSEGEATGDRVTAGAEGAVVGGEAGAAGSERGGGQVGGSDGGVGPGESGESDGWSGDAWGAGDADVVAERDDTPAVAVVGRPNVGKSTLFNRLVGDERSVVHDLPGTTRDAVDTVVETPDGPVRFVDTAGMRRRSRIDDGPEYYSLVRALAAVDRSDVALLVIDATEGVTHQDQRLAERVDAAGCPIVVVCNKWELLDAEARVMVDSQVAHRLRFLGDPPVLRISALSGKGVHRILPVIAEAIEAYRKRVPTRAVNVAIAEAQAAQPAPGGARVLYATQGATDPPTFTLFTNRPLPAPYLRYLERQLRERLGFGPTPLKLRVRRRGG